MSSEFYWRRDKMPGDEDSYHEYKGHRSFLTSDIGEGLKDDSGTRNSRRPISLAANGMLNNGKGGTIYLGVLDDGSVEGFCLSPFQKDHIRLQAQSMFDIFASTAPEFKEKKPLYRLRFIPVLDRAVNKNPLEDLKSISKYEKAKRVKNERLAETEHIFGDHRRCWCDHNAGASWNFGILFPFYIVEIIVLKQDENDFPVYATENATFYYRYNASNISMSKEEILQSRFNQF